MARARQQELTFRSWGGAREGAGRPRGARVSHDARPVVTRHTPVHVTLRCREHVWNLRSRRCFRVVEPALRAASARGDFRVVHFSVQGNHLHLVVEARSGGALARGMQALSIRLAKGLNRLMRRRGPVFTERYHAHALRTPAEARRPPEPRTASTAPAEAWLLTSGWRRRGLLATDEVPGAPRARRTG